VARRRAWPASYTGTQPRLRARSAIRRRPACSELLLELGDAVLQLGNAFPQGRQLAEHRRRFQPFPVRYRGIARHEGAGFERVRNAGLRCGATPLPQAEMAGAAALARQHDIVVDDGAAGDADLRGDERALADGDAVGDLDQVVDLRPGPDPRLTDRG